MRETSQNSAKGLAFLLHTDSGLTTTESSSPNGSTRLSLLTLKVVRPCQVYRLYGPAHITDRVKRSNFSRRTLQCCKCRLGDWTVTATRCSGVRCSKTDRKVITRGTYVPPKIGQNLTNGNQLWTCKNAACHRAVIIRGWQLALPVPLTS